jgi:anaerobic ribonucleoside-triphosphate reductase activating protein
VSNMASEASERIPLRISGVEPESIVDGPGFRYVVFTQGCPHHCPGCHNPQTHDFEGGEWADLDAILREIREDPLLQGVTFSGGEPFCQPEALCVLAREVRAMGKDLVVYSGYTLEQLQEMEKKRPAVRELLELCDILVDGPYIEAQRDLTLRYRGSANQRVIRLRNGEAVGLCE